MTLHVFRVFDLYCQMFFFLGSIFYSQFFSKWIRLKASVSFPSINGEVFIGFLLLLV